MTTYYMLFKRGRNNIADTQWFVNRFVDSDCRESDLKWIEQHPIDFEDTLCLGVFSEYGEPFTFLSKYRTSIPDDWIEVRYDTKLGEL